MGDPVRDVMGNLGQYASTRDRSLAEIVRDVIADVQEIGRAHV